MVRSQNEAFRSNRMDATVWFYNLRVGRSPAQVRRELQAMIDTGPAIIGLCEGVGYSLPRFKGYRLIRDRSTRSRANVAAYVRREAVSNVRWHDMHQTWGRTEHPGVHEARSWLEFRYFGVQVLVGHQPPKFTNNTIRSQQEGIDFLVGRMAPWTRKDWADRTQTEREHAKERPRLVIMDANRHPKEEGPGPHMLAQKIDGQVVGTNIDLGVARGLSISGTDYVRAVGGVDLKSDHEEALRFKIGAAKKWLSRRVRV